MGEETWELPPAEHPIGVYIGLVLSSFILSVGSVVLFLSLYAIFKTEGFRFTSDFLGRSLLFFGSAYGAVASISALINMMQFQKVRVKKVEKEFKDFTVYARPLVEEVIRQRLVSQNVADQLEQMKKVKDLKETPSSKLSSKVIETLVLVAVLANATVGLFLYHDVNPWTVPYSVMFLAIAWWLVIAWHFDFLHDSRSYYIPAIYVLIVPTLSIILRGYIEFDKVLFSVFLSLILYILTMYVYYSHITLGHLPSFIPNRFKKGAPSPVREDLAQVQLSGDEEMADKLNEFMPPKNKGD